MTRARHGRVTAGVMLTGLIALGAAPASQQATFRARRDMVRVDVLVTDRNGPVRDLTAADFQVFDNGVLQEAVLLGFDETPVHVVLALDLSGSVAGERLAQLRDACRTVLGALRPDDRAGLIGFSHAIALGAPLTSDFASVLASLNRTSAMGGTALFDASYGGLMVAEADAGRSLLIVFSDGVDTSSWLTADAVLDAARRSAVVVYGLATTRRPPFRGDGTPASEAAARRLTAALTALARAQPSFLRDLSALTGGSFVEIESTKDLGSLFLGVLDEFRMRHVLMYTPTGVSSDGWHRIDVRMTGRRGLTVKARPGYQAGS